MMTQVRISVYPKLFMPDRGFKNSSAVKKMQIKIEIGSFLDNYIYL